MRFLWQILVDLPPGRDETFCRANSNNPAFDDVQRTLRVIVYSLLSLFLCSSMFKAFTILSSVPFFLSFFLFFRYNFFPFLPSVMFGQILYWIYEALYEYRELNKTWKKIWTKNGPLDQKELTVTIYDKIIN